MGPIKEAAISIGDRSLHERELHVGVRDIRHRNDDHPRGEEMLHRLPQRPQRITQVLKDVTEEHGVGVLVRQFVP